MREATLCAGHRIHLDPWGPGCVIAQILLEEWLNSILAFAVIDSQVDAEATQSPQ
jgi:hypothetical protein